MDFSEKNDAGRRGEMPAGKTSRMVLTVVFFTGIIKAPGVARQPT